MLVDTHCHLNFASFDQDRDQVISRARETGLGRILIPGITFQTSQEAIFLSSQYPDIFAAVGVHPTEVQNCTSASIAGLAVLLPNPKVIAIGEIGLDNYWEQSSLSQQMICMQKMLELAARSNLPAIIHIRNHTKEDHKATEAAYNILSEWYQTLPAHSNLKQSPGVLHSYDDNFEWAEKFIRLNFFLGIAGRVTYRKSNILKDVVVKIPLEYLLLETDAPFLSPEPGRRQRNEPQNIKVIAEVISEIKNIPYDMVESITTLNARRLFAW